MTKHSIIIVEDDKSVRDRLVELIEQHESFEILDALETMTLALDSLKTYRPDILLTDLGLPDGSGTDIIRHMKQHQPDCKAMVISGFQDEYRVFEALEAGANAYILKHDKSHKITDAIMSMMQGGAPISPVIARLMLQKFQQKQPVIELPEALTDRQAKILKLVSQGFSSREISEKLNISYYTVTTHIKNIYGKLQVNSRTEALHEATKFGLLS